MPVHSFVIDELALGNLRHTMHDMPQTNVATNLEVLHFIHEKAIFGRGIGHVHAYLLASIRLTAETSYGQKIETMAEPWGDRGELE